MGLGNQLCNVFRQHHMPAARAKAESSWDQWKQSKTTAKYFVPYEAHRCTSCFLRPAQCKQGLRPKRAQHIIYSIESAMQEYISSAWRKTRCTPLRVMKNLTHPKHATGSLDAVHCLCHSCDGISHFDHTGLALMFDPLESMEDSLCQDLTLTAQGGRPKQATDTHLGPAPSQNSPLEGLFHIIFYFLTECRSPWHLSMFTRLTQGKQV